jgi:hypothetical protein
MDDFTVRLAMAYLSCKRGSNMKSRANRGAGYISERALELAELARSDGFELLAYLLSIAAVEATQQNKAGQEAKP